jgi:NurA-like 5'-3' nuclease
MLRVFFLKKIKKIIFLVEIFMGRGYIIFLQENKKDVRKFNKNVPP